MKDVDVQWRLYSPEFDEWWAMNSETEAREYLDDPSRLDLQPTDCRLESRELTVNATDWREQR